MGLGEWTTIEGVVSPSDVRYGGGFQWRILDENRTASNKSVLQLRPYIKKLAYVSDAYAAFNLEYQTSYFTLNDANRVNFNTAFDFREADIGVTYPLSASYPFKTNRGVPYVEYVIQHDSNGNASVKVDGYIKGESTSSYFQYVRTTQAIILPRIDRSSTLTVAESAGIGEDIQIYVTKAGSNDLNTIKYSFGQASGVIAEMSAETQFEWHIPTELTAQIPEAASGICTLSCETYGTAGLIGSSTKEITLYVKETPTFTPSITVEGGGDFIRNVSTIRTTFLDAAPTQNARIVAYAVSDGTTTYTGEADSFLFTKAKNDTYTFGLIDSRGLKREAVAVVQNVIPYELPAVGRANYDRDIETGDITISFAGQWYGGIFGGIDNTSMTVYVELLPKDGTESIVNSATFTSLSEAQNTEFYGSVSFNKLTLEKAYTAYIVASDNIYSYGSETYVPNKYEVEIARAVPTFQWNGETLQVNGSFTVTGEAKLPVIDEIKGEIDRIEGLFGKAIILWDEDPLYMRAAHTAELSEPVSEQNTGIVLVWSAYENGAKDYNFFYQFVPKYHVEQHNGKGVNTGIIATETFGTIGSKYVYVYDDRITGNDYNDDSGTKNGITYNNAYWVLRYVLGL